MQHQGRGSLEDYTSLKDRLDTLNIPYYPMAGNHDNRFLLRSTFTLPDSCMREYIQYSIKTPERTFLCLDTLKPGSDAGELCKSRLDWLSDELQTASDHPVYLFMHHPPMKLGLPMQDTEKVESGDEFLEAIEHSQQLKYMFTDQSLAV